MCSGTSAIKEELAFVFKQSTVLATTQPKHRHEAGVSPGLALETIRKYER